MQYRKLGRTGLMVSEIGLGGEWLNGQSPAQVKTILDTALQAGINCLDIYMPQPQTRSNIGAALRGRREQMIIQGHLCAIFADGQYTRTRNLELVQPAFQDLLDRLETHYIDLGMIHYVDSMADYEQTMEGPVYDYACRLKEQGVIRFIGMSSHNPQVALRAVESGKIEVLLFSINPAYDFERPDLEIEELMELKGLQTGSLTADPWRHQLYTACEAHQVGITVMKPLASGSLLHAASSPFGIPLSVAQCCHYCLTRPGVCSVLVGCETPAQVLEAAGYAQASPQQKDYSAIFSAGRQIHITGRCMYCNHCQPCPAHIDVAMVTKLLDLARQQVQLPETVREHYLALEKTASDCLMCGSCETNCPFGVQVRENMRQALQIFGR